MGTWICHLRVADLILEKIPGLDEVAFAYGNLAPDSDLPNDTWTEFDPPKEVTHYLRRGSGESAIHDLDYYREYLAPYIGAGFPLFTVYRSLLALLAARPCFLRSR